MLSSKILLKENIKAEQTDGPNYHAFGTFVTDPADAGSAPKASGSRSSGTFAENICFQRECILKSTILAKEYVVEL